MRRRCAQFFLTLFIFYGTSVGAGMSQSEAALILPGTTTMPR